MKRLTAWVGVLAVLIVMGAVLAEAGTTLRLGHTDPADGLRHKAATVFADKVKEHTQGRYAWTSTTAGRSAMTRSSWSR